MAKVFYISYDLRGDDKNYNDLWELLKKWKGRHILQSVWSIKAEDDVTCLSIKERLIKLIDEKEDGLIVIKSIEHSDNKLLVDSHS